MVTLLFLLALLLIVVGVVLIIRGPLYAGILAVVVGLLLLMV